MDPSLLNTLKAPCKNSLPKVRCFLSNFRGAIQQGAFFLQFRNLAHVDFSGRFIPKHRNEHLDLAVVDFSDLTCVV